jgi:hypothetical protein
LLTRYILHPISSCGVELKFLVDERLRAWVSRLSKTRKHLLIGLNDVQGLLKILFSTPLRYSSRGG